jgi:hypothetical protein
MSDTIEPSQALKLIQKLHTHREKLTAAAKQGGHMMQTENDDFKPQERAS